MFPLRDHNPSNRTPYVTWALIAINVVVFASYSSVLSNDRAVQAFFYDWALVPAAVSQGQDLHGFLTSMFLHGGWMHLGGNMLFLWIFGDNLEDILGHVRYLLFYLAGGLAAAMAQYLAEPYSMVPMVGASGAIAGVMGGYLLMFPKARVDILVIIVFFFRVFSVPAWVMLGFWFAMQLISGASATAETGGVAYWAHAGGFAMGLVLMLPVWLRRGGPGFWSRNAGHPPHPEAIYARSNVPKVTRKRR
ncbi:rhomboid family intramembrane serine protease [Actibacterium sp.]|uniref:rhomboid family intramembrane serine protease n=1 Tax=Actibacterium sp. TaxID=1872125 RepID=UPI003569A346